jgi:serine/threonine protein kinase
MNKEETSMKLISKGGYSEVFYDSINREVYRRTPKYFSFSNNNTLNDKTIDMTGVSDLIFTKSFEYTTFTPVTHSETIGNRYISSRMPYYGQSLHEWNHTHPYHVREQNAPRIMLEVIMACMYFDTNAFYHPDLKPSNILVYDENMNSNQEHIVIIDFNLSSVKIINEINNSTAWINTVGTWNFCPPEIILEEQPKNNSISWTIGVISAMILDDYPFSDVVSLDMQHNLIPQQEWKQLFIDLYKKYPDHPPLLRYEWYNEKWGKFIWNCTHWDNKKRWDLYEIYKYVYEELLDENDKKYYKEPSIFYNSIDRIKHEVYINRTFQNARQRIIKLLYKICKKSKLMNVFPTAITIYDRYMSTIDEETTETYKRHIIGASFILSCSLFGLNTFEYEAIIKTLMENLELSDVNKIIENMHCICLGLDYNLWEKPVQIVVDDKKRKIIYNKKFWEHIRDAFIYHKDYYTQDLLAEYVLTNQTNDSCMHDICLPS